MNKQNIKLYLSIAIVFQMFVSYLKFLAPDSDPFILIIGLFLIVALNLQD